MLCHNCWRPPGNEINLPCYKGVQFWHVLYIDPYFGLGRRCVMTSQKPLDVCFFNCSIKSINVHVSASYNKCVCKHLWLSSLITFTLSFTFVFKNT